MKAVLVPAAIVAAVAIITACADTSRPGPTGPGDEKALSTSGTGGGDTAVHTGGGVLPRVPAAGPVVSIRVTPASQQLPLDRYGHVHTEGLNAAGEWAGDVNAAWISSDESIVAVRDTGILIPRARGTATVTASFAGLTARATVTVVDPTNGGGGVGVTPVYPRVDSLPGR